MLSLRLEDQFPVTPPARQQRWLRGAALSLAVHLVAISALVLHARQQRHWEGPGPAAVDLARSAASEPVTVGLADRVPSSLDRLPALDDGGILPLRAPPPRLAGAPAAPSASSSRVASGQANRATGALGRGAQTTKLASDVVTPIPPIDVLPPPTAEPAAPDPVRAAFRSQLRRHLHEAWHANEVFARIDPQGRLEGSLFTTAIQVRLGADGGIEKAELAESSGIAALDKEALAGLARMEHLPAVPPSMLDDRAGWSVLCKFYLDVGLFRFAADIRAAISDKWRPSRAYAVTSDQERKTVLRFVLDSGGTLISANVIQSAGIDFLDSNALAMAQPGMHLPAPPPAFMRQPGPANVFVAFLHHAGDVRVLKPREDVEDQ